MAEYKQKTMLQKAVEKLAMAERAVHAQQLTLAAGTFAGNKVLFMCSTEQETEDEKKHIPLSIVLTEPMLGACEPDFELDVDLARRALLDPLRKDSSPAQWTTQWLLQNLPANDEMTTLAGLLDKKWESTA